MWKEFVGEKERSAEILKENAIECMQYFVEEASKTKIMFKTTALKATRVFFGRVAPVENFKKLFALFAKCVGCCVLSEEPKVIVEISQSLAKPYERMRKNLLDSIMDRLLPDGVGEGIEMQIGLVYFIKYYKEKEKDKDENEWKSIEGALFSEKQFALLFLDWVVRGVRLGEWELCKQNVAAILTRFQEKFREIAGESVTQDIAGVEGKLLEYILEKNMELKCNCGQIFQAEYNQETKAIRCICGATAQEKCDFSVLVNGVEESA